jgi:hypothetical protein
VVQNKYGALHGRIFLRTVNMGGVTDRKALANKAHTLNNSFEVGFGVGLPGRIPVCLPNPTPILPKFSLVEIMFYRARQTTPR